MNLFQISTEEQDEGHEEQTRMINTRWFLKPAHILPRLCILHKSSYDMLSTERLLYYMVIDLGKDNLKDQCKILKEYPDKFQNNSYGR